MPGDLHRALTEAAAANDSIAEEYGLDTVCDQLGLDPNGLTDFALQRGLRLVLIESGRRHELKRPQPLGRPTSLPLTDDEHDRIAVYASAVIDGVVSWRRHELDRLKP